MSVFGGGHGGGFGGGDAGPADISLNLTALMDILSNLLFFLLASYTTQALEVKQKPDLQLPASSSQLKLSPSVTLTVTKHSILVADVPIANVEGDKITGTAVDETDKVAALYDRLRNIKSSRAAAGRDDLPDSDLIMLLADRTIDSAVITKVLKTAGMAGFTNIRFGVLAQ